MTFKGQSYKSAPWLTSDLFLQISTWTLTFWNPTQCFWEVKQQTWQKVSMGLGNLSRPKPVLFAFIQGLSSPWEHNHQLGMKLDRLSPASHFKGIKKTKACDYINTANTLPRETEAESREKSKRSRSEMTYHQKSGKWVKRIDEVNVGNINYHHDA